METLIAESITFMNEHLSSYEHLSILIHMNIIVNMNILVHMNIVIHMNISVLMNILQGFSKKSSDRFLSISQPPKHLQKKLRAFSISQFRGLLENVQKLND